MQEEGEPPLTRAVLCTADSLDSLIDLLLDHGADIDAQDDMGRSVLMTCVTFGVTELLPLLLGRGARLGARDHARGRTVFHYCVDEEDVEGLELLVLEEERRSESGGKHKNLEGKHKNLEGGEGRNREVQWGVNVVDHDGASALHFAVRLGNAPAVEVLLRHPHVDVNTVRHTSAHAGASTLPEPDPLHATQIHIMHAVLPSKCPLSILSPSPCYAGGRASPLAAAIGRAVRRPGPGLAAARPRGPPVPRGVHFRVERPLRRRGP